MKIEVVKIIDRGIPNKERLHLSVKGDANLSFYIVFATRYLTPTSLSSKQKTAYWFDPKPVKSGDTVVLYTGTGVYSTSKNPNGSSNHFFYWGLNQPIWSKTGDCAVLFEVNTWKTSKYE